MPSNKTSPITLPDSIFLSAFVILIQITSLILTSRAIEFYTLLPSYEPAGQSTGGSMLNSFILIIFTFAMTTIMLMLIKFRKLLILKILMILSIGIGTFLTSYIIFNLIFYNVVSWNIAFLFATMISILGILSFMFPSKNVYTILTSFILASLYGTSLSLFIKPPTVFMIPVFFGLYDIYTVFRGPLKSLINESKKIDHQSVVKKYEYLNKIFPRNVGLLHGKIDKVEKENILKNFLDKKFKILVSTTVIEVGIDNPNATIMLIENVERFGLTQLHQLRGRIGRGNYQSYCMLLQRKRSLLSDHRLKVMENTSNGFKISDEDLQLRGPGEFFGKRQHGYMKTKI